MKTFLFLSWRDIRSPKSGGAEVHTHGLMRCFLQEGCRVIHFAPVYESLPTEEEIDGITYLRQGGIASVIKKARKYYHQHKNEIDYVVDQCNTHRFFTRFWVPQKKRIFYIHQLTKEIWDINMKFPLSWIGKHTENAMLRLQRFDWTITVSESTRDDLLKVGFQKERIVIVPNAANEEILGLPLPPVSLKLPHTFLYAGRYSKYKGIDAAIKALGMVKAYCGKVKLHILGKKDEDVIRDMIAPLAQEYGFSYGVSEDCDVVLHGFVSGEEKYQWMRDSYALLFPSLREGWGIIVTEAAALGTPSIVYDSPGCRDAVNYGKAGYLCKENTSEELARLMLNCMQNEAEYSEKRQSAYDFAQRFSWKENQKIVKAFLESLA